MRAACVVCQQPLAARLRSLKDDETYMHWKVVDAHTAEQWVKEATSGDTVIDKLWCTQCDLLYNHCEDITTG